MMIFIPAFCGWCPPWWCSLSSPLSLTSCSSPPPALISPPWALLTSERPSHRQYSSRWPSLLSPTLTFTSFCLKEPGKYATPLLVKCQFLHESKFRLTHVTTAIQKQNIRAAGLTLLILSSCLLCWIPVSVTHLMICPEGLEFHERTLMSIFCTFRMSVSPHRSGSRPGILSTCHYQPPSHL